MISLEKSVNKARTVVFVNATKDPRITFEGHEYTRFDDWHLLVDEMRRRLLVRDELAEFPRRLPLATPKQISGSCGLSLVR